MLKEGLDVFIPLVDDYGIDAVIRRPSGDFVEVQIKARSTDVIPGDAALFAAIVHATLRENYYFVFYSERMGTMWILSSEEFIREAVQNKAGKNIGKRSLWFNLKRKGPNGGDLIERPNPKFNKYIQKDFSRFK